MEEGWRRDGGGMEIWVADTARAMAHTSYSQQCQTPHIGVYRFQRGVSACPGHRPLQPRFGVNKCMKGKLGSMPSKASLHLPLPQALYIQHRLKGLVLSTTH